MALTLRGTASANAINGGNPSITLPAGMAIYDAVYVFGAYTTGGTVNQNLTMNTAGYTELADLFADDTREAQGAQYRKLQGSTPDSTAVFNGFGNVNNCAAAVCHVWIDVDQKTPEDTTTIQTTGINGATVDSASITTVTPDVVVLSAGACTLQDASVTAPTNYINQDDDNATDTAGGCTVMMASRLIAAAGAENPAAWTNITGGGTSDAWVAVTVAIRPTRGEFYTQAVQLGQREPVFPRGRMIPYHHGPALG